MVRECNLPHWLPSTMCKYCSIVLDYKLLMSLHLVFLLLFKGKCVTTFALEKQQVWQSFLIMLTFYGMTFVTL